MDISNTAINRVGEQIRKGRKNTNYNTALNELNYWREAHGPIMNKYYHKCRRLGKGLRGQNIMVAERLKRLPTIIDKLNRFPDMNLSRMQDIAGVRIVVQDMEQLSKIERKIKKWKNYNREKDYIQNPKEDGYRGKHLIFKENNQYVEIQLRTQLQHIWATSIETVDTFNGSSMKTKQERGYWHDFFLETSAVFSIAEETNVVDDFKNLPLRDICKILEDNINKNNIEHKIQTIGIVDQVYNRKLIKRDTYYLVLDLDFQEKKCNIFAFKKTEYNPAVKKYQELEYAMQKHHDVVLISVNDIRKLKDFYPNYFLDLRLLGFVIRVLLAEINKKG